MGGENVPIRYLTLPSRTSYASNRIDFVESLAKETYQNPKHHRLLPRPLVTLYNVMLRPSC